MYGIEKPTTVLYIFFKFKKKKLFFYSMSHVEKDSEINNREPEIESCKRKTRSQKRLHDQEEAKKQAKKPRKA